MLTQTNHTILEVGNGTDGANRKNIFEIYNGTHAQVITAPRTSIDNINDPTSGGTGNAGIDPDRILVTKEWVQTRVSGSGSTILTFARSGKCSNNNY